MSSQLKKNLNRLGFNSEAISGFCSKWKIKEFLFFGSILTDRFTIKSDVDILISYEQNTRWSLFSFVRMKEELAEIIGRDIDLVSKRGLEYSRNYLRKQNILSSAEKYYVSG